MDPSRRAALGAIGLYSSLLVIPGWADVSGRFELLRKNPRVRIGCAEVDAVRSMTDHLSTLDDQFGGRTVRPMAAAFLVNTIAPYLQAEATPDVRAQMLSAAADHCYLTGYLAVDDRADGLAQHYYVKALELAGHANDHLTYCTTLRGMSVLAVDLRHTSDALRLADAAPQAGPGECSRSSPANKRMPPRSQATAPKPWPSSEKHKPRWTALNREPQRSDPTTRPQ
ncbi:MAG: hypothetical protein ACRDTD_10170 [Pseudonocardiaceae bacterium]